MKFLSFTWRNCSRLMTENTFMTHCCMWDLEDGHCSFCPVFHSDTKSFLCTEYWTVLACFLWSVQVRRIHCKPTLNSKCLAWLFISAKSKDCLLGFLFEFFCHQRLYLSLQLTTTTSGCIMCTCCTHMSPFCISCFLGHLKYRTPLFLSVNWLFVAAFIEVGDSARPSSKTCPWISCG